jgi:hypothetical protein
LPLDQKVRQVATCLDTGLKRLLGNIAACDRPNRVRHPHAIEFTVELPTQAKRKNDLDAIVADYLHQYCVDRRF